MNNSTFRQEIKAFRPEDRNSPYNFPRPKIIPFKDAVKLVSVPVYPSEQQNTTSPLLYTPKMRFRKKESPQKTPENVILPNVYIKEKSPIQFMSQKKNQIVKSPMKILPEYSLGHNTLTKLKTNDSFIRQKTPKNETCPNDFEKICNIKKKEHNYHLSEKIESYEHSSFITKIKSKLNDYNKNEDEKKLEKKEILSGKSTNDNILNKKLQFLKEYMKDSSSKISENFIPFRKKIEQNTKIYIHKQNIHTIPKNSKRFHTPDTRKKNQFLISDNSFCDETRNNTMKLDFDQSNLEGMSYLADDSLKMNEILKSANPKNLKNKSFHISPTSTTRKKMSLIENISNNFTKKKRSLLEVYPVMNSGEIAKKETKKTSKITYKFSNEISTNDEFTSCFSIIKDLEPKIIENERKDSIPNLMEDSISDLSFEYKKIQDDNIEKIDNIKNEEGKTEKIIQKSFEKNNFSKYKELVPEFYDDEDIQNNQKKKLEMILPLNDEAFLTPRCQNASKAIKTLFNVYNNSKYASPDYNKTNEKETKLYFDVLFDSDQKKNNNFNNENIENRSIEINPLNSIRSSIEEN